MRPLAVIWLVAALLTADAAGAQSIRIMILDGESGGPYHDWPTVTDAMKRILEDSTLFDVTVVTAPGSDGLLGDFAPDFAAYDTIVLNYDAPDGRWPDGLKTSFEQYVREGGGVVAVHAADNAFPDWAVYNEIIGVGGWRGRDQRSGPYWFFQDGELVQDDSPGNGGSHGQRVPFLVTVQDRSHPITNGLPPIWMHGDDELYAELRGPGTNMTVLATAYSDPANAGSGRDEPQLIVLEFGSGRIFHMTFGHDLRAISSTDFATLLKRGAEWSATGEVTQVVPADFPTADAPSYDRDLTGR